MLVLKNRAKTPLAELTTNLDVKLNEIRAKIKELKACKRNAVKIAKIRVSTPLFNANKKRKRVKIIDIID